MFFFPAPAGSGGQIDGVRRWSLPGAAAGVIVVVVVVRITPCSIRRFATAEVFSGSVVGDSGVVVGVVYSDNNSAGKKAPSLIIILIRCCVPRP